MKFPSIQRLITEFNKVVKRFPLEIFFAFTGSAAATALVELEANNLEYANWCWRIIMAAETGLLLSLSASLFSKSHKLDNNKKLLSYLAAVLISITFLFVFNPIKRENDIMRFFMVCFGFHLLVAFASFIGKKNHINAFWQLNKTFFLRMLTAILYSGVLYIGLAAAIGSMNFLFNFKFEGDTFAIMGIWIAGVFQTLFFLSGIPDDIESLQEDHSYPKGLKLFTQYVLIPLASIYALILLSYEIKILVQWNMPKGLVSSLILSYAVFGILSFLLIYPLRNLDEHKWIKNYSKSFYFLLVPLLILLYLAVFTRVEKYGVTEGRYFLIALALWLSFITFYFLVSKRQNIVIIPVSLCIVTLLAVYGPLSAFRIAEKSQLSEIKKVFAENHLLSSEDKLKPITIKLDSAGSERIQNISRYLITKYGLESLQPILKDDLSKVTDSIKLSLNKSKRGRKTYNKWDLNEAEHNWLHKKYKLPTYYNYSQPDESYTVLAEDSELIPLNSADFLIDLNYYHNDTSRIHLGNTNYLTYSFADTILKVRIGKESKTLRLYPLLGRLQNAILKPMSNNSQISPRSLLTEEFDLNGYHITALFNRLQYRISGKEMRIISGDGVLLLKKQ